MEPTRYRRRDVHRPGSHARCRGIGKRLALPGRLPRADRPGGARADHIRRAAPDRNRLRRGAAEASAPSSCPNRWRRPGRSCAHAIALLTVFDAVAASCVALYGIKDAMQDAGHAFSATKYGASTEPGAFSAGKTGHRQGTRRSPRNTTGSRPRSLHPFGPFPDSIDDRAITPTIPKEIGT